MPSLRLALAQLNPQLGNLAANAELAIEAAREAAAAGADVVALPEMALTGYPVEDLALRRSFQEASRRALGELAAQLEEAGLGDLVVLVGYLDGPGLSTAGEVRPAGAQNALAVLAGGVVQATYVKHHLPNYGVFDEARYFVPGEALLVLEVGGVDVALAICEDLWQEGGPVAATRQAGAGLLIVVNGSPYERGKTDVRLDLIRRRASQAGCPLAYVNLVGGQDELVFDGASVVVSADGQVLAEAQSFAPDLLVVDLDLPDAATQALSAPGDTAAAAAGFPVVRHALPRSEPRGRPPLPLRSPSRPRDPQALTYAALVTGTRDYVRKNGFATVILGVSGGIDSALTAAIACDALGPANVYGVGMPSAFSSQHSRDDAADLAARTGLHYSEVPIQPLVDAFLGSLTLDGLALENLQARVRGMILMSLSNQQRHLVLATGNKSELAVGYSTLYGDAVGAYAPLKDVLKTDVWHLSAWRNAQSPAAPPIPESSITKPPSAELRPGQLDTDSLPDYEVLDALLVRYVERDIGGAALVAEGCDAALVERVLRLVDLAEYKRRQYPPGPKVSVRNFGRDRRLPLTNAWRERF